MEQARADHVAAQTELEEKREQAEDTQTRLEALDSWAAGEDGRRRRVDSGGAAAGAAVRGVEKQTLEQERAAEAQSRERTEGARVELDARFEDLSVVERLAIRHAQIVTNEQMRRRLRRLGRSRRAAEEPGSEGVDHGHRCNRTRRGGGQRRAAQRVHRPGGLPAHPADAAALPGPAEAGRQPAVRGAARPVQRARDQSAAEREDRHAAADQRVRAGHRPHRPAGGGPRRIGRGRG